VAKKAASRLRDAEGTKATILTAARERFAADGYERATIRAIAAEAKIDPALVMRYFGNKEKLFAAAASFDLGLPDLMALPRHCAGAALVAHFIERWERDDTFMALLRAAATNEAAAKRVLGVLGGQVAPVIAQLSGEPTQAATRAGLVSSQILGLALCRYVLRLPPLVAMTRNEMIAWLGPTIQRYITGSSGE
jgi:AcrR family transcriptional regulator